MLLQAVALPKPTAHCAQPLTQTLHAPMQGTQNWLNLGVQSYSLWAQSLMDGISNDDQTGVVQPKPPARRLRE